MWTNAQVASFERTIAGTNRLEPVVLQFEEIAKHAPQFADRIRELRTRLDMARTLATVALTAHSQLSS